MYPVDKKEYIVTLKGDTINGSVRIFNSYDIVFEANGTDEYLQLNPDSIQLVVEKEDLFYKPQEFINNGNKEKVFLRELISGDVAFYEFLDSTNSVSYYVKKRDDKFRRLNSSNHKLLKKALLLDCDSIPTNKINLTGHYGFNVLASQISMHNSKCSSVENPFTIHYKKNKRKKNIFLELKMGAVFTQLSGYYFEDKPEITHYGNFSNMISSGFNFGVGLQIGIKKNFYWNPDLLYTYIGDIYYGNGISNIHIPSDKFDFSPVQFIFRSNKFRVNPNISLGLGLRYSLLELSNLMLSLGTGFDFDVRNGNFIKVQFNYKLFTSDNLSKDGYYYSTYSDSFGINLSYLIK